MFRKLRRLRWAKHQQRWFGKWHVYLGIIAGFIIAIVGVTGSILVFQDEIDIALNKELFLTQARQQKIELEEIIPIVERKYPALKFDYAMNETDKPNRAYQFFNFATENEFFIDPYTAMLSGKRLHESSFIHIVTEIHRTLLIPAAGRYIVGIATLILIILTISGLRLWIPQKWKHLKSMLTVNFKASFKRQNYDWHNVIGFYTAPFVTLISITGFCITFSALVIPFLFMLSGKSPQGIAQIFGSKSEYRQGVVKLTPKQVSDIAMAQMTDSRVAGIALPTDSTAVYRLDLITQGIPKSGKREMIVLDQYSGKIYLNSRKDFPDVGNAYLSWLTPIHFGSFGGIPTKILALIGGLSPLLLFITGFIIWYPRWKKQKRSDEKRKAKLSNSDGPIVTIQTESVTIVTVPVMKYFKTHLKKSLKYAAWSLLIAAIMGVLYGVFSGIIIQPAVFSVAYVTVLIVINFIIALLTLLFNIIFLAPFKKGSRPIIKYFTVSLGFCLIFLPVYFILMNAGLSFF